MGNFPLSETELPEASSIPLFGIRISRLGLEEALQACLTHIEQKKGGYVCFVNVHTLTDSTRVNPLRDALNDAFLAVADGVPLVWASRLKRNPIKSRVCGPDFSAEFFNRQPSMFQGFIGGAPGQAAKIIERFGLNAVHYSPPMRPFSVENALADWKTFVELCPNRIPPGVVWIGLGAPKQEFWMRAVSKHAPQTLFMGVGAVFDFHSGTKKRAPYWMQRTGLEWLHRLASEPKRLGGRYFSTNSRFLRLLAQDILKRK